MRRYMRTTHRAIVWRPETANRGRLMFARSLAGRRPEIQQIGHPQCLAQTAKLNDYVRAFCQSQ